MKTVLQPADWPRPRGYANGVSAQGRQVFVAGMVGWNAAAQFDSDDLVDQVRQDLENGASYREAIIGSTVRRARPLPVSSPAAGSNGGRSFHRRTRA